MQVPINEFNTSKLCNKCEEVNSLYLKRKSKNPKYNKKDKEVWGQPCVQTRNVS